MKKKANPNKAFMEEIEQSMLAGTVHTLTPEQRKQADKEIQERRRVTFLKSMILSTMMLYNLDELHELKATEFKLKKTAKDFHGELEKFLNDVFDIADDPEAANFLKETTDAVDKLLDNFTANDKH